MILILLLFMKGGPTEIKLPAPVLKSNVSLEECIAKRRSVRDFTSDTLTLAQISQLLWSAQGITDSRGFKRAAPSAGATYPLEIRVVKNDGVFRYIPQKHSLKKEQAGDLRKELAKAALGQSYVEQASCNLVISAVYERTTQRYGQRGIMYVHIEVGHCAQNIHLEAVALGLGSVPIGAFQDDRVKKLLMLPKNEEPLYIIPVGYPVD